MDRLFVPLMFVFVAWMTSSVDADIGSNCSATTECDPVNNTATVCDTTANTFVCKVGAGSVCNGTQCVENAVCSTVCTCNTDYRANSEKLCLKDAASGIAVSLIILLTGCLITYI
ncbi:uncharacterized protein LOC128243923 [Mya arenaria]|uniref:uncharacterized protein LOC128243923 n=1 Tax=Mya arenaria TaxID=6604 RepID=UPI0022E61D9E|nr:uncharacterized protein LOC128243923 [Mya arenaria]